MIVQYLDTYFGQNVVSHHNCILHFKGGKLAQKKEGIRSHDLNYRFYDKTNNSTFIQVQTK